jgi:hypothetical protein
MKLLSLMIVVPRSGKFGQALTTDHGMTAAKWKQLGVRIA